MLVTNAQTVDTYWRGAARANLRFEEGGARALRPNRDIHVIHPAVTETLVVLNGRRQSGGWVCAVSTLDRSCSDWSNFLNANLNEFLKR
jgi:hypothetical protein